MEQIEKQASQCRVASPHDNVYNSECVYTFHSPYTTEQGILVNLCTFLGSSLELSLGSDSSSSSTKDGTLFVRIVKRREEKISETNDEKEEMKTESITKLGVGVEGGFQAEKDKFDIISTYSVILLSKETSKDSVEILVELPYSDETKSTFPEQVQKSVESIIHHSGYSIQQDLSAWELDAEPIPISQYYDKISFVDNGVQISPNPGDWKCEASGDTENLWLNLSDGYIGGGRRNWDGSGGSNGALDHYKETGEQYPLVVKLGTISQDTSATDCYSYAKEEDGPVMIPNLTELLEKRGIKVSGMQKTVKSTAELEVELNATYAFDAITEAGANLVPLAGPELQGLQNLGNSCYMNSVCQTLFSGSIPELSQKYSSKNIMNHALYKSISAKDAASNVLCQAVKMTNALTSGNFVGPLPESATVTDSASESTNPKYRLAPRMFKNAFAKGHCDFVTGQQQDAVHYLQHILEVLDKAESEYALPAEDTNQSPSSHLFAYQTVSRLVCSEDNMVKYKTNSLETVLSLSIPMDKIEEMPPDQKRHKSETTEDIKTAEKQDVPSIQFKSCFDSWIAPTSIQDMKWPHLQNATFPATNQNKFETFPPYLFVSLQRYRLGADWVPEKLEVNVEVPEEIDLNEYKSKGPMSGESLITEEIEKEASSEDTATATKTIISESALDQLSAMGFSVNGCKRALLAVGGSDVESAMNWIFEHNMDPDFNDPPNEEQGSSSTSGIDESVVDTLVNSLGCFTSDQVRAALEECESDAARAADWLFSNMDNLDEAITLSKSKKEASSSASQSASPPPLQDGDGKYTLIGLISHIGKHTGSGHYVCHLKKDGKWVIFNDEKVALSESPPIEHAYIYLFKRKACNES